MDPDVFTVLNIVNATPVPLVVGTAGPGLFNQYQMYSWFGYPSEPNPICASASIMSFFTLQFLRGQGDEDDGADIQINLGVPDNVEAAVMWLQARSDSSSRHHLQMKFQNPSGSWYAYAYHLTQHWARAPVQEIQWGVPNNNLVSLDPVQNGPQSVAIVDLLKVFPDPATAMPYFVGIAQSSLTSQQKADLYSAVTAYVQQ